MAVASVCFNLNVCAVDVVQESLPGGQLMRYDGLKWKFTYFFHEVCKIGLKHLTLHRG